MYTNTLWNFLVITPTTTTSNHSLSVYTGVDGIYFSLNSHQHRVRGGSQTYRREESREFGARSRRQGLNFLL